jgi:hypothetical protein
MKRLLLGSVTLTLFAISVTVFQISCQKDAQAQTTTYTLPPATTTTLGGVIIGNGLSVTSNGTLSVNSTGVSQQNKFIFAKSVSGVTEIWIANYDGTNAQRINIIVPTGLRIDGDRGPQISPDRQRIFFLMGNFTTGTSYSIYSCKLDGSDLIRVIDGTGTSFIIPGSVY